MNCNLNIDHDKNAFMSNIYHKETQSIVGKT